MSFDLDIIWSKVGTDPLRRLLLESGFKSHGLWGRYMERFQKGKGARASYVLVPVTNDIVDFEERMRAAISDLAAALDKEPYDIVKNVMVSDHTVFKVRARPGQDITSIPFDEARAIILNSWRMIKSSAVVALSQSPRRIVHGRSPYGVDEYMNQVRLGQTEVGSFVFNFLLPVSDAKYMDGSPSVNSASQIAKSIQKNLQMVAEINRERRVPSISRLEDAQLTANFCSALYNIIDWSDEVTLQVGTATEVSEIPVGEFRFNRSSLAVLEKTSERLAPEQSPVRTRVSGTIVRLSEPAKRRRGSVDMVIRIEGRRKTVRVNFESANRDTVIQAFREKDIRLLTVSGFLRTAKNGHLTLEDPQGFDATRRGTLL